MPLEAPKTMFPPLAKRLTTTSIHHGETLTDDYAWLRADNWQEVMRKPDIDPRRAPMIRLRKLVAVHRVVEKVSEV